MKRIYVAGHQGLVGSAIVRALTSLGYDRLLLKTKAELDLRHSDRVRQFFTEHRPDVVFLAAAVAGGIHANSTQRWRFIYDNLAIQNSVISAAHESGVGRLVFFGSSCIYPREAPQPLREEYLLTGPLEPTNEPYAVAKIAGVKLVEAAVTQFGHAWVSLMPTNLYGPGDNFDLETSHVLPGMMARFHAAKSNARKGGEVRVDVWGDGTPLREFLHVDDLARAALAVMDTDHVGLFNVGSGREVSIRELAEMIRRAVRLDSGLQWDATRPNGTPRKLLDSSKFMNATGWRAEIDLEEGIEATYRWYASSREQGLPRLRATVSG
jgi:GDP-L-fucose synthase